MLIVHAEHGGGNNSAFTCRVVSSSATDTYSAISAATCSLKGPRHGGANLKVCQMLDDITENVHDITNEKQVFKHLCNILRYSANDGSGLIYGMGHAIYTQSDPRAIVLKTYARHLAKEKGFEDQLALVELVEKLTPRAFAEVRGQERVISANVDLYSGLVYQMLGIPREMFTPLFATSRIAGWMAHRLEEISFNGKIMRPGVQGPLPGCRVYPAGPALSPLYPNRKPQEMAPAALFFVCRRPIRCAALRRGPSWPPFWTGSGRR